MSSTGTATRPNSWIAAALVLWIVLGWFVWAFDLGGSNGPYPSTGWEVIWAATSVPSVGVLGVAYLADRLVRGKTPTRSRRPAGPIRTVAKAAGVLGYVILFLAAIPVAIVIFFQSRGMLNPDAPLPLWELSVLFGLLTGTCILLGSQLPSVDRSAPDYELYQDGSPPSKRDE